MRAVLFGLLAPGGKTTTDEFEGPGCIARARMTRDAAGDDFPEALWAINGDAEARDDDAAQRSAVMFGITYDEAVRILRRDS